MEDTPFTADQPKNRNAHQDITNRESQDAAEKADVEQAQNRRNNTARSQADKLEERLIDFAVRIIRLAASLPKTAAGRHVAGQILRSGTSPAPNYGEARGAESHADFVHKLRIVVKELNETSIWLRIIDRSGIVRSELLVDLVGENSELCKIFAASLTTGRQRSK
ncbi:MAG: four helix bundle protein [Pyrinomonadaceae bacterium]|nr:four helix bundle protein [Pyrinomonadaceae bacterium]